MSPTPAPPWVDDANVALLTDLYQLTMLQAYHREGREAEAVFSLYFRTLPPRRNYALACGLEDALRYLERLRFDTASLDYLAGLGRFSDAFLRWLSELRFTGDVWAVAEGTPIFPEEPLLEVVAPLPQAQLVESYVMNQIHLQTVLAAKAARVVTAAAGRPVIDFGMRRIHGTDAALKAARAGWVAGIAATSNVLAGKLYGLPVAGTMAHSYVQSHPEELDAFRKFAELYPETVLLVDTYDTLAGVRKVIELAKELGPEFRVSALRLDSGDLAALTKKARELLDAAGLERVGLFASGGLDEDQIAALLATGAPVAGFGVGTRMGTSEDAPTLDVAYKLTSYAGSGRLKLSPGKRVLPGRKQLFRRERDGRFVGDVIARAEERLDGRPLLEKVMTGGERTAAGRATLEQAREHARRELAKLPEKIRALAPAAEPYPVEVSAELLRFHAEVARAALSSEEPC